MTYCFTRSSFIPIPRPGRASLVALLLSFSSLSAQAQEGARPGQTQVAAPPVEKAPPTVTPAPTATTQSAEQTDAAKATPDAPSSEAPASDAPRTEAPAPAPSKREVDGAQVQDDQWIAEYLRLKSLMLEGRFDEARQGYDALVKQTSDPTKQRLAVEMSFLAQGYVERGVTVVSKQELDESELGAKTSGQRSTYEIALLYTNAVVYGAGTGAWIAALSQTDHAAGVALPMIGFSLLGAGAVYWADSTDSLRYGVPHSIVTGMYLGATQGILWSGHAGQNGGISIGPATSLIWGGATLGALAGGFLGHNLGTTPGRASWVGSTALWTGAVSGFAVGAATSEDAAFAGAAIGHGVGIIGGLLTAGKVAPSVRRVIFIDLGAIAGGLTGVGLYAAAAGDSIDGHAMAGFAAGSIAVGAVASYLLTEGMTEDLLPSEEKSVVASLRPSFSSLQGGGYLSLSGQW